MNHCPDCGASMPAGRLAGLCPVCFLSGAAAEEVPGGESGRLRVPGLEVGYELARGGMGIVYAAEQREPRRPVALKVLQPRWREHPVVCERFRGEARAMAELEHPAILPVHAVGEVDGLPWFTMKLATGGSLADRLAEFNGRWRDIATLVARLADALAFAHQHGVIHRDLKPGNILFGTGDEVWLADFGLAKRIDTPAERELTAHGGLLGTPAYLAPELAGGRTRTATTASDIYSLGAVLYALLAGVPPFNDDSLTRLLERVAEGRPPPVATAAGASAKPPPADLAAICSRAMEREPGDRYASAGELAEDLRRFLRGEAVAARQLRAWETAARWCRRHPAVASLLTVVALLVLVLTVGSTVAAVRVKRAEQDAILARDAARDGLRRSVLAEAEGVRRARLPRFRAHSLRRVAEAGSPDESPAMRLNRRTEAIAALAFPEMFKSPLPPAPAGFTLAAVAPGHSHFAWQATNGAGWRVTRPADGRVIAESRAGGRPVRLSRNGQWLATAVVGRWQLWDLTAAIARQAGEFDGEVGDLSDDGTLVAWSRPAGPGGVTALVDETRSGQRRCSLSVASTGVVLRFSADGRQLALAPAGGAVDGGMPDSIRVHTTADGRKIRELRTGLAEGAACLAWSRDGTLLAAGERGGATLVWDADSGNTRHTLRGTGASLRQMVFSGDGRHLAAVSDDRLLTVFDLVGGQPVARGGEATTPEGVPSMEWSDADPWVFGPLSVDDLNTLIRLRPGAFSTLAPPGSRGAIRGLAITPDGASFVVGDARQASWWMPDTPTQPQPLAAGRWNSWVCSTDGQWLYGAGEPGVARWRIRSGAVDTGSRVPLLPPGPPRSVALDRAGGVLAVGSTDGRAVEILLEPGATNFVRRSLAGANLERVAVSPDGRTLAAAGRGGVRAWRVADGAVVFSQPAPAGAVAFNHDGSRLVIGRGQYELLDSTTGRLLARLGTNPIEPAQTRAAFTPDGRWLATAHPYGRIALWEASTGSLLAIVESPNRQPAVELTWDPAARRLVSAGPGGALEIWDLPRLRSDLKTHELDW